MNPLYDACYTEAVTAVTTAITFTDYIAARLTMQAAWNAVLREMLQTSEPCARCRGRMVIAWRGCLYPCPECCKIDGLS